MNVHNELISGRAVALAHPSRKLPSALIMHVNISKYSTFATADQIPDVLQGLQESKVKSRKGDGKIDALQHLFTTDRTPSTLQDQESFKSDWQVIRKYSSL